MKNIDGKKVEELLEAHRAAFKKCVRLNLIMHNHKERVEAASKEQKDALAALAEYVNARSGFTIIH